MYRGWNMHNPAKGLRIMKVLLVLKVVRNSPTTQRSVPAGEVGANMTHRYLTMSFIWFYHSFIMFYPFPPADS